MKKRKVYVKEKWIKTSKGKFNVKEFLKNKKKKSLMTKIIDWILGGYKL